MEVTILVVAALAGMCWGWYHACKFVASREGRIHVIAYLMMFVFWPGGIPGTIAGYKIRTGESPRMFRVPEMPPSDVRQRHQ